MATDGSDSNSGTQASPFATMSKFNSVAQPGDVLYVRGGVYYPGETILTKSGTVGNPITIRNYPDEVPIIDGQWYEGWPGGFRTNGIVLEDGVYSGVRGPKHHWVFDGLVLRNWKVGGLYFGDVFGRDRINARYSVTKGNYDIRIRYRSNDDYNARLSINFDDYFDTYDFPNTGGSWSIKTISSQYFNNDGTQPGNSNSIRLERGNGDMDIDWIEVVPSDGSSATRVQAEDGELSGMEYSSGSSNGVTYVSLNSNGRSPSYISVHDIEVRNCIVDECGQLGIRVTHGRDVTIKNSIFSRTGWDIRTGSWSSNINFIENDGENILVENCVAFHGIDVSCPVRDSDGNCQGTDGNGLIVDTHGWTKGQFNPKVTVKNSLFFKNGGAGVAWTNTNDVSMINNTLYENGRAPNYVHGKRGIVLFNASKRAVLRNNIVVESSGVGLKVTGNDQEDELVSPVFDNNLIAGQDGYQNPQLIDPSNYNFKLKSSSPAINAGSTNGSVPSEGIGLDPGVFKGESSSRVSWYDTAPDLDFIRNKGGLANCFAPVSRSGDPDIGAYEFGGTIAPPPPPPPSSSGDVVVQARVSYGSTGILELRVDDNPVQTWTVNNTNYQTYSYDGSVSGNVKLFFRDENSSDVQVDYLRVDGTTYQAEAQAVNISVWQNGSCGGSNSELMHCRGYIDFGMIGSDDDNDDDAPGTPVTMKVQAEDGSVSGTGVSVQSGQTGYEGSGYVGNFTTNGDQVSVTFQNVVAGNYTVNVRYQTWSSQQNYLIVNGSQTDESWSATGSSWSTRSFNKNLQSGTNTIAIRKNYGYMNVDYIEITPTSNARTASVATKALPDSEFSERLTLYPNPATGTFYVSFAEQGAADVAVFNLVTGQLLHQGRYLANSPIRLDATQGAYLVRSTVQGTTYRHRLLVR